MMLLLGWPAVAWALNPDRDISQYNCQTWTRRNGLPVNGINAIAQTRDGYLWLGTASGLVRFDGVNFKLMDLGNVNDLPDNFITCLATSRHGGLWIGLNDNNFGYFDGREYTLRRKDAAGTAKLPTHSILETKDGTLWFTTEVGVFRQTGKGTYEDCWAAGSFTNFTSPVVLCSYQDHLGRFWFGTGQIGVYYWQSGKISKLNDPDLEGAPILCLAEDQQGEIWIGTANGLFCYDANLRRKAIPPLTESPRALLVDRHGVLWIGTTGRGLARFWKGGYEFLQRRDGLADNSVNALAEDSEGDLWVGTRYGISQLTDVKFSIQPAADDPKVKDALSVSASPRGGIWIGSASGATYVNGVAKTYASETGMPKLYIKRVFEAGNGDVYLVCQSYWLAVLREGRVVATYTNQNMFVGMTEDAHGMVVSAGGGLFRMGANYFQPYVFKGAGDPPFWWILNLAPGRGGVIWVASVNGIFCVKDGEYRQWSTAQGLADAEVNAVCEDRDGVVWAATLRGIARLKNDQIRMIDRKHGLFDDNICAIVPDDYGYLWVDSRRGIFRVRRQAMNDFADGRTDHVECMAYDGFESVKTSGKTVQENVGCKSTDGRIWFPYPDGVVAVDPAHLPTNNVPPPVNIERLLVNGKEVAGGKHLVAPPGKGELEFHFNALSFIAPQKIHFRYQLEGYDKTWVEAADRRMAFYTNLKPGDYRFRVIAANADGVWNLAGDEMEVVLQPHFYETIWFYFLGGGFVCALLAGIYLARVQHLERKHQALQAAREELESVVRNRTQELAQTNISLKREVDDHKQTADKLEQRTKLLENEIEERKRMQLENERVQRELLETSREAGMAEVATSVLHNVGNVLNSVNVSAGLLAEQLRKSKVSGVNRMAVLLEENRGNLAAFLAEPGRADQIIEYLKALGLQLGEEQSAMREETRQLTANIEHIKRIVAMQQSYAKVAGVTEMANPVDLVEDSLRMDSTSLARKGIQIARQFDPVPSIVVDKNKVLQILVNLIRNGRHACDESSRLDKCLTVQVRANGDRVQIAVADNGVGIPPENLTRIFNHGFTTRQHGHGFGLHSGALAAKEMGGNLTAFSEGRGTGACFTLELPFQPPQNV